MEMIKSSLTGRQIRQLQEVADGMLKIYRTLVRMQYIEEADIEQGPHDLCSILPLCRELEIDNSITYLYSILPYVQNEEGLDFVQQGAMMDLREKSCIREARNPMFMDEKILRPWMTALSSIGNSCSALIYDSRRHVIGISDQMSVGSVDPNIHERDDDSAVDVDEPHDDLNDLAVDEEDTESERSSDSGRNHIQTGNADDNVASANEQAEEEEEKQNEDNGEEDEESDQETEYDPDYPWDEMEARPAQRVLNDIVGWYEDLTELPGDGEYSGLQWRPNITKSLYIKCGWPSSDFDGERFLVEQARAYAIESVIWDKEDKEREEARVRNAVLQQTESNKGPRMQQWLDVISKTEDVEEEWMARWEVWQLEQALRNCVMQEEAAREEAEKLSPDNFNPSFEQKVLEQLREDLEYNEEEIVSLKDETPEQGRVANVRELARLEKRVRTLRKAHQSYMDDENVIPMVRPEHYDDWIDLRKRLWFFITDLKASRALCDNLRQWLAGVPEEATRATAAAGTFLRRSEERGESAKKQISHFKESLLERGYSGYPLDEATVQ